MATAAPVPIPKNKKLDLLKKSRRRHSYNEFTLKQAVTTPTKSNNTVNNDNNSSGESPVCNFSFFKFLFNCFHLFLFCFYFIWSKCFVWLISIILCY
jgi:hypothetical protein